MSTYARPPSPFWTGPAVGQEGHCTLHVDRVLSDLGSVTGTSFGVRLCSALAVAGGRAPHTQ